MRIIFHRSVSSVYINCGKNIGKAEEQLKILIAFQMYFKMTVIAGDPGAILYS